MNPPVDLAGSFHSTPGELHARSNYCAQLANICIHEPGQNPQSHGGGCAYSNFSTTCDIHLVAARDRSVWFVLPPKEKLREKYQTRVLKTIEMQATPVFVYRIRRCVSHGAVPIFQIRYLHSSWNSSGAKKVGAGNISPRACRRRIVPYCHLLVVEQIGLEYIRIRIAEKFNPQVEVQCTSKYKLCTQFRENDGPAASSYFVVCWQFGSTSSNNSTVSLVPG